jgi:hypothetical protein
VGKRCWTPRWHVTLRRRTRHEHRPVVPTGRPRGPVDAYHGDFPEQFAHIGFLTAAEAQRLEVDPAKVAGLPILGVDPVADYRPLIAAAGLNVEAYEKTPGWEERAHAALRKAPWRIGVSGRASV